MFSLTVRNSYRQLQNTFTSRHQLSRICKRLRNRIPRISRHYSSHSNPIKTTLLILGNSNIGHYVAEKALQRGHRVYVTTRSKVSTKLHVINYIHTPQDKQQDPSFWRSIVKKSIPHRSHLLVLNTIGGSVAAPNQTIEDLNIHTPISAIKGIAREAKAKGMSFNVVHLSSSVAAELEAPYGKTKRIAELRLMDLPVDHLTIFRMSYVVEALFRDTVIQTYKEHHKLSPEEFALLPFSPLLGNPWDYKKVVFQPVSMGDVATAVFNTVALPNGKRLINAVGKEEKTQEECFKFYTDLLGKKFRPIYIPIEAAEIMAKHHPFGHCVSYPVEFCAKDRYGVSHEEFEELVGSPLQTMADLYRTMDEESSLVIPRPPLLAFMMQIFKNIYRSPQVVPETIRAMGILSKSLFWNGQKPTLNIKERPIAVAPRWVSMSEEKFNENSLRNRIDYPDS